LSDSVTRIRVPDRSAAEKLFGRLQAVVERSQRKATLSGVTRAAHGFRAILTVDAKNHELEFEWAPPPESAVPRLAVVIDDMGRDLERARAFLDLNIAITPAILPHLSESRKVALLAQERGREYLVHVPMQPEGYPDVDPGPGALLENMDETEIRKTIAEDLQAVPGAAGINNHMGSRLTALEVPMRWLMAELKGRGLYFVDSVTTARSVAVPTAGEAGLGWARRDVFLDNVQEQRAIGEQIAKAIQHAKQTGRAVAIGHPHRETLRALEAWAPKIRESGVRIVSPSELLQRGNGA
jgi:polysaccharide deacetylase 2 family uncharacterized protein YibQ